MNPITVELIIAGHVQQYEITPTSIRSEGRKRVAYGMPSDEQLQFADNAAVVTVFLRDRHSRERLCKQIKAERIKKLSVDREEVFGLRVTRFEKGWPNLRPRVTACQIEHPQLPRENYEVCQYPWLRPGLKTMLLADGHHPRRKVCTILNEAPIDVHTDGPRVVISDTDENLPWKTVVITQDPDTAVRLSRDLLIDRAPVIEINTQVRAIVIQQDSRINLYGFDHLSPEEQLLWQQFGATKIHGLWDLPGYTVAKPMTALTELGWKLDPEVAG